MTLSNFIKYHFSSCSFNFEIVTSEKFKGNFLKFSHFFNHKIKTQFNEVITGYSRLTKRQNLHYIHEQFES